MTPSSINREGIINQWVTLRGKQGYTAPLVIREAKLLLGALAQCVQQNLLAIQVSYLIPDMVKIWETIETELEISVKALLDDSRAGEGGALAQRGRKSPRPR